MNNAPIRCEKCGVVIIQITRVEGYFHRSFPAILHEECYREMSEKAYAYNKKLAENKFYQEYVDDLIAKWESVLEELRQFISEKVKSKFYEELINGEDT